MPLAMDPTFVGDDRRERLEHLVAAYEAVAASGRSRLVVLAAPTGWGKTRIVRELYGRLAMSAPHPYWPPRLDAGEGSWLQARKRVFPPPFDVGEDTPIPFLWLGVSCQRDQMGRELAALQYAEQQFQSHVGPLAAALESTGERWKARLAAAGAVAGLFGLPDPVNLAMTWHGIATSGWEVLSAEWRSYRDRNAGTRARRVDTHQGSHAEERGAEMAEQLARLSGRDLPVVLVIDDAHWADPGTVRCVGKLLNTPGHVLILATAWPDQLAIQADEVGTFGHALQPWLDAGRAERHDLDRLADAALVRLIESVGGGVDSRVVRALCDRADGNPNRLQGLMSLRVVRRALAAGGASLTQEQIDTLPAGDAEIIGAIWRELPEHVREVLALSTLQGSEFNPDWIPAAAGLLDLTDAESGLAQAHSPWGWVRSVDAALAAFVEAGLFERASDESMTLFLPDELTRARTALLRWAADQKRRPDWDTLSAAARRAVLEAHFLGAEQSLLEIDEDVVDSAHRLLELLAEGEELARCREVAERGVEWTGGKPELADLHWTFRGKVADAMGLQGDYEGALERYRSLLEEHAREHDVDSDAHLELRRGHAWLLMHTGEAETAVAELGEIVDTLSARHGDHHEGALRARRRRGVALQKADRAREAVAEFDRLLELLAESDADEGEVLHARTCRADALGYSSRGREAISELQEVLEAETRRVGRDHPVALHVRNNLGHWLLWKGRTDEARVIFEGLVADRLSILGPDHPSTLASRGNLVSCYENLGDLDRAEPLSRQLLADKERVLGPHHPMTLVTRSNLASALREAGRLEEALVEARNLLEGREHTDGPLHPWTLRARLDVASLLADTGRTDTALPLFGQVLEELASVLGWDHRITLKACLLYAEALRDAGRSVEGRTAFDTLVARRADSLGPTHVDTLRALVERAAWTVDTARGAREPEAVRRALDEMEQVVATHEEVLDRGHPLTRQAQEARERVVDALQADGWDEQPPTLRSAPPAPPV